MPPLCTSCSQPPFLVFLQRLGFLPCSPLCWGSATCPRWGTWTAAAPGTPSPPGSLAPPSCSGTRQGREGAFALSIVLALCPLSGGCRTCGLRETTKATGGTSAHTGRWEERAVSGAPGPWSSRSSRHVDGRAERKAGGLASSDKVSVRVATGTKMHAKGRGRFSSAFVHAKAQLRTSANNTAKGFCPRHGCGAFLGDAGGWGGGEEMRRVEGS